MYKHLFLVSVFFLCSKSLSAADFNFEHYGHTPEISSISISPDGKHYGYIKINQEGSIIEIINIEKSEMIFRMKPNKGQPTSIFFATNRHVIISGSKTDYFDSTFSGTLVYDLATDKTQRLLKQYNNVQISGGSYGQSVGVNRSDSSIYVPADRKLLKVSLETGKPITYAKGGKNTIDWFVDKQGKILAREDYDSMSDVHSIYAKHDGKWKNIFSETTELRNAHFYSYSSNGKNLVFTRGHKDAGSVFLLSLEDGSIKGPVYELDGSDVRGVLTNSYTRELQGIRYNGLLANFQYLDDDYQTTISSIQATFPRSAVHPVSKSLNLEKTIFMISGNEGANDYLLFDAVEKKLTPIAKSYPNIPATKIAEIKAIKYKARDGISISAIMTWPEVKEKKNLPLLVFPHGGPESYSDISFNWWSQYFARKGYLILQPNFRGSTGFGLEFRNKGRGKWGQEMQDDISDGVEAMIASGYVDPDRICIMGSSYGGYAALAGGAFTPKLYKCVISVAGISDLNKMLYDLNVQHGRHSSAVTYWKNIIGDAHSDKEKLDRVSPINSVKNFQAPLLLIHGKDDYTVPILQSRRMQKAMQKLDKSVELVELKGADHWLSNSKTRLELLENISRFLDKHNPVKVN